MRLRWPETGEHRDLRGHLGAVLSVTFSADGRTLVSGGYDGFVRLWPLPPTGRGEFERWLMARSPWRIVDGQAVPNELPGLTDDFLDARLAPPPGARGTTTPAAPPTAGADAGPEASADAEPEARPDGAPEARPDSAP